MTTKFLLVLKICKSAANATVFLISGNPYLSKDVTETLEDKTATSSTLVNRFINVLEDEELDKAHEGEDD